MVFVLGWEKSLADDDAEVHRRVVAGLALLEAR
jgi:hypothetical protein